MTDGHFADASRTWIGDVNFGMNSTSCFMLNSDGNAKQCSSNCVDQWGNGIPCEHVMCEKVLSPVDKYLCLHKGLVIPSKIGMDKSTAIMIPVSKLKITLKCFSSQNIINDI